MPRLIALLCLIVVGCGPNNSGTLPPDPPQVSIYAPEPAVADTRIKVSITVTGCDKVESLQILDGQNVLKEAAFIGNPTPVELFPNEIPYTTGIAADLGLYAKVRCSDGRSSRSQPQPVYFLPVAEAVNPPNGSQTLPDVFYAERSGTEASFVGCRGNLIRVNTRNEIVHSRSALPFACDSGAVFSERNDVSKKRWLWQPGAGAFAFDDALAPSGRTLIHVGALAVGPDGDAVVYDPSALSIGIARVSHATGQVMWARTPQGPLRSPPLVRSDGTVMFVSFIRQLGDYEGTIVVEVVNYTTGIIVNTHSLWATQSRPMEKPWIPPATLSADGSTVYFPVETQANQVTVYACSSTAAGGCQPGAGQLWASASLPARITDVIPFANNSMLAAIGGQFTWFLNAATGAVVNPRGEPLRSTGALVTKAVQAGKGSDFYLLTGAPDMGGQPTTLPLEIIAVDSAAQGEVFRFGKNAGNVMVGVDDGGQTWIRIGAQLVRPLPLSDYRQARQ